MKKSQKNKNFEEKKHERIQNLRRFLNVFVFTRKIPTPMIFWNVLASGRKPTTHFGVSQQFSWTYQKHTFYSREKTNSVSKVPLQQVQTAVAMQQEQAPPEKASRAEDGKWDEDGRKPQPAPDGTQNGRAPDLQSNLVAQDSTWTTHMCHFHVFIMLTLYLWIDLILLLRHFVLSSFCLFFRVLCSCAF